MNPWRCLRAAWRTMLWMPLAVPMIVVMLIRAVAYCIAGVPRDVLADAEAEDWQHRVLQYQAPYCWPRSS